MGNHEHYNGDFAESKNKLQSMLESNMLSNVYLLDKETKVIDDTTFIGGTLWTDMNNGDELTLYQLRTMMNDFRCVKNSNRMVQRLVPIYEPNPDWTPDGKNGLRYATNEAGQYIKIGEKKKEEISTFSPQDAFDDHKKMLAYLKVMLEGKHTEKFVVVGHHAPSKLSTHPRYKNEEIMNGGYSSDLSAFILDNPQIKLWTHGHTHEDFDYMLGSTRIVCNPRGYDGYEDRADNFTLKYVDV
jgi:hypothetical protein